MKISYINKYHPKDEAITKNLVDYFEDSLRNNNYYGGELEDVVCRAENNSKAIGRLVEILSAKGILHKKDILKIAGTENSHENISLED